MKQEKRERQNGKMQGKKAALHIELLQIFLVMIQQVIKIHLKEQTGLTFFKMNVKKI